MCSSVQHTSEGRVAGCRTAVMRRRPTPCTAWICPSPLLPASADSSRATTSSVCATLRASETCSDRPSELGCAISGSRSARLSSSWARNTRYAVAKSSQSCSSPSIPVHWRKAAHTAVPKPVKKRGLALRRSSSLRVSGLADEKLSLPAPAAACSSSSRGSSRPCAPDATLRATLQMVL